MERQTQSTQFIVLAKTPYQESSLILGGFSPDFGRLQLMVKGAMRQGGKDFPVCDLYRELDVNFIEPAAPDGLCTATGVELLTEYDAIADNQRNFKMAGRIGGFLLDNLVPGVAQPITYDCFKTVLSHLAGRTADDGKTWDLMQCSVAFKMTYLQENGFLPAATERQQDFIDSVVEAGVDNGSLPDCQAEYWGLLNNWLNSIISYHQLKK